MTKDETLKLALDWYDSGSEVREEFQEMIESTLAQPQPAQQEPVGEAHQMSEFVEGFTHCIWDARVIPVGTKLYTSPPQRKPLTEDEIYELVRTMANGYKTTNWLCRAIESAHNIKE